MTKGQLLLHRLQSFIHVLCLYLFFIFWHWYQDKFKIGSICLVTWSLESLRKICCNCLLIKLFHLTHVLLMSFDFNKTFTVSGVIEIYRIVSKITQSMTNTGNICLKSNTNNWTDFRLTSLYMIRTSWADPAGVGGGFQGGPNTNTTYLY